MLLFVGSRLTTVLNENNLFDMIDSHNAAKHYIPQAKNIPYQPLLIGDQN